MKRVKAGHYKHRTEPYTVIRWAILDDADYLKGWAICRDGLPFERADSLKVAKQRVTKIIENGGFAWDYDFLATLPGGQNIIENAGSERSSRHSGKSQILKVTA